MTDQEERKQLSDRLYEQYGRPLEKEHRGKFIAITEDGKTVMSDSLLGVVEEAEARLGSGVFVFKLGDRVVGRWLRTVI
jgi:hypothetical protein